MDKNGGIWSATGHLHCISTAGRPSVEQSKASWRRLENICSILPMLETPMGNPWKTHGICSEITINHGPHLALGVSTSSKIQRCNKRISGQCQLSIARFGKNFSNIISKILNCSLLLTEGALSLWLCSVGWPPCRWSSWERSWPVWVVWCLRCDALCGDGGLHHSPATMNKQINTVQQPMAHEQPRSRWVLLKSFCPGQAFIHLGNTMKYLHPVIADVFLMKRLFGTCSRIARVIGYQRLGWSDGALSARS